MTDVTSDPIYQTDALIASDIDAYLETHQHKSMLRFITCGSVDEGKSTLIGRLLYDSKMIFEDQLATLEADSKKMARKVRALILPCWSMALLPSANRASPLIRLSLFRHRKTQVHRRRYPGPRTIHP